MPLPIIKLFSLLSISFQSTLITHSIPFLKYLLEASLLILQISKMILSIVSVWIWEILINTEIIDLISIALSVYISTSVLLEMCSYEIVITWNSSNSESESEAEYEENIDLA